MLSDSAQTPNFMPPLQDPFVISEANRFPDLADHLRQLRIASDMASKNGSLPIHETVRAEAEKRVIDYLASIGIIRTVELSPESDA